MTVISSTTNPEALTLTLVAEFDASVNRVWQVWEDPRQLERWWGPPTWPATFHQHDLAVGAESRYYMTGPDGDRAHAWWRITSVDAPRRIEFDNGFGDDVGEPIDDEQTTRGIVTLDDREQGGTRMSIAFSFSSVDVLDRLMAMGMQEGLGQAVGQIDAILSERAPAS